MRYLLVFGLILSCFLSACAPAPEAPPDPTPKPTFTLRPHGTLKSCFFFEGEPVEANFNIVDKSDVVVKDGYAVECVEVNLPPGEYMFWGSTDVGDECASTEGGTGCFAHVPITIELDEILEMDLDLLPPE